MELYACMLLYLFYSVFVRFILVGSCGLFACMSAPQFHAAVDGYLVIFPLLFCDKLCLCELH